MLTYMLDTNVLSELAKPRPSASVLNWVSSLEEIAVSVITLEELTFGVERAPEPKRAKLLRWLQALVEAEPRIVPVDASVARLAGRLRAMRELQRRRVAQADMLIAASALSANLVLSTRNTRDFEGCGVALFNPFER
jgi:toxin FitB